MGVQVEAVALEIRFGETWEAFPGPPHTEGSILGTARQFGRQIFCDISGTYRFGVPRL
jgi:hypothetical protein